MHKYILQITQPSQYKYTQLQYRFEVISEAPSSRIRLCGFWVFSTRIRRMWANSSMGRRSLSIPLTMTLLSQVRGIDQLQERSVSGHHEAATSHPLGFPPWVNILPRFHLFCPLYYLAARGKKLEIRVRGEKINKSMVKGENCFKTG